MRQWCYTSLRPAPLSLLIFSVLPLPQLIQHRKSIAIIPTLGSMASEASVADQTVTEVSEADMPLLHTFLQFLALYNWYNWFEHWIVSWNSWLNAWLLRVMLRVSQLRWSTMVADSFFFFFLSLYHGSWFLLMALFSQFPQSWEQDEEREAKKDSRCLIFRIHVCVFVRKQHIVPLYMPCSNLLVGSLLYIRTPCISRSLSTFPLFINQPISIFKNIENKTLSYS